MARVSIWIPKNIITGDGPSTLWLATGIPNESRTLNATGRGLMEEFVPGGHRNKKSSR